MEIAKIDLQRLGQRVRFLRQGKGWTLADLAEKAGVSKAYISDLENCQAGKPNIQYVYAIAVALEITLDELLDDAVKHPADRARRKVKKEDLPPGLAELQQDLDLTDDEVAMLANVNFRGNRPKDKEGWRFLFDAIKMVGQQKPSK